VPEAFRVPCGKVGRQGEEGFDAVAQDAVGGFERGVDLGLVPVALAGSSTPQWARGTGAR